MPTCPAACSSSSAQSLLKSKQFYCLCSGAKAVRGVNLPGESRSSARHWNADMAMRHWNADMAIEIVNSELRKSTGDEENSSPPVLIFGIVSLSHSITQLPVMFSAGRVSPPGTCLNRQRVVLPGCARLCDEIMIQWDGSIPADISGIIRARNRQEGQSPDPPARSRILM